MSEQDFREMLRRTAERIKMDYYVLKFITLKWPFLSDGTRRELLEIQRDDIAQFLPSLENFDIFLDAPDRKESSPPAPADPPAPEAAGVAWW